MSTVLSAQVVVTSAGAKLILGMSPVDPITGRTLDLDDTDRRRLGRIASLLARTAGK